MKSITKILQIGFILAFGISSSGISYAADAGAGFFKASQYSQSYNYYMDRADRYLDGNQLEAALNTYKRALMIHSISEEAKEAIEHTEHLMAEQNKGKQVNSRTRAIKSTLKGTVTKRPARRKYRPPVLEEPSVVPYKPKRREPKITYRIKETPKKEPSQPNEPNRPNELNEPNELKRPRKPKNFFNEFMNIESFSDGIDSSIQQGVEDINVGITPSRISGEYRMAVGFTSDDVIWKDANADHSGVPGEKNWRYLFGQDGVNTFDKEIYSRFRLEAGGIISPHLKGYTEIVIDPWTFVGRKNITIDGAITGQDSTSVNMVLKYWSNSRRTINEVYRAENGDIVSIQENKIINGRTSASTYSGLTDWGPNSYAIPSVEIDDSYVPIRKLWLDYDNGPYHMRFFPMASQRQALRSDDPLRLSDNKIWWEESAWLDEYEPSRKFIRSTDPMSIKQGQWIRRLSSMARDSDYERLTFLRGGTIAANFDNGFSFESTFAAPRSLWDYYDEVTSVPGAVRFKLPAINNIELGGTYTAKLGLRNDSLEAQNHVGALDVEYSIGRDTSLYGELAFSFTNFEEVTGFDRDYWGAGYTLGFKNENTLEAFSDDYSFNASFTHFNDNFLPGLSNYRFTRMDSIYGKHLYFDELRPENEEFKVGNGIDIDRVATNVNLKAGFFDNKFKTRVDWRDVRTDSGGFIEDVTRVEAELKAIPKVTVKGMLRYMHLPKTVKGIDPLINAKTSYIAFSDYFSDEDVFLQNTAVEAGKDPSIGTYSIGLKYDMFDNLSIQGIYEITNDPLDMPRGLLNDVFVTTETRDGVLWDKIVPFLYNQGSFGLPPYEYYNIYKGRMTFEPFEALTIKPSYVYNENKYATTMDDNVTHVGLNVEVRPNKKLTLGAAYFHTRIRDLWTDVIGGEGYNFEGHDNFFFSADYEINQNQNFSLLFGEYAGYGSPYYEEYTSIGPLDTQHLVRLVYEGKF